MAPWQVLLRRRRESLGLQEWAWPRLRLLHTQVINTEHHRLIACQACQVLSGEVICHRRVPGLLRDRGCRDSLDKSQACQGQQEGWLVRK